MAWSEAKTLRICRPDPALGLGVETLAAWRKGDVIHVFTGEIGPEINQHSLQVDATNHITDTTFIGYTSRWISTVWMGDDMRERPLGHSDAAYIVVEPLWARFMAEAAVGHPNKEIPWEVPAGIDPKDRGDAKGPKKTMSLVYRERSGPPPPVQIGPPEG